MPISDLPVQIDKLISWAVAIAFTPFATVAPTTIGSIITTTTATPAPVAPWTMLGATKGGASYNIDVKSEELTIDQRTGGVFDDITEITRVLKTDIAGLSSENWKLVEQAPAITTTASQKTVLSGAFAEYDGYRVAFIGQRRKSQVTVGTGAAARGGYVVFGFFHATLSGSGSETKFDAGALATRSVEFKAFPDTALTPGADTMFFFEELAT